tara:strand:+ start:79265 stop:82147 length:2883 start_codon:yes stop_codon:yes gene_type:complete
MNSHRVRFALLSSVLCFFALILLGGMVPVQAANQEIIKSPNDIREYQYDTLKNGMKVIVVHDPKAIKSACSLEINVGSNHEPDAYPGLAHFLEHMMFLGTEKYPETDQFQTQIHNNGGEFNASTGADRTHYYFNIQADHFQKTIDQFSEFFKTPLLTVEHMDRERKNVDSEFRMYLNQDNWRVVDVSKETSSPAHPFHRFSVGNVDTLPGDKQALHAALTQFHQSFYSSDRMTLVLVGPQSTKQLMDIARKYFSEVKQKETPKIKDVPLFTPEQMGVDIKIKAQGNGRQLMILFALPDLQENYKEQPLHLLSQFMGYEGEGSLYAALKNKGWITSLSSSADSSIGGTQDLLQLAFQLTPMGLKHVDDITQYTFNAIGLLKEKGYPEQFFKDIQAIHQLEFTYHERESETTLASNLAHQLQEYDFPEVISCRYLMPDVSFEQAQAPLNKAIQALTHQNMRRFVISPDILGKRTSKWFGVEYSLEALPSQIKRADSKGKTSKELALPEANPYIPNNLKTQVQDSIKNPQQPVLLEEGRNFALWHVNNATFTHPKANILINLANPNSMDTAEHQMQSSLYALLVFEELKQKLYPAIMVGESINLYAHPRGLTIQLGGYSDKQAILLETLVSAFRHYELNPVDFDLLKERLERDLKNFDQLPLFQQAIKGLSSLFIAPSWHPTELLTALEKVTSHDLEGLKKAFVENSRIEMFVSGNYSKQNAKNLAKVVQTHFSVDKVLPKVDALPKIYKLPQQGIHYKSISASDKNHTLVLYAQSPEATEKNIAAAMILSKLIGTPMYQALRVEKQMGYALGSFVNLQAKVNGLNFFVQSPDYTPEAIYDEIQNFLVQFGTELKQMKDEAIAPIKKSLVNELLDPDKTLDEQSIRFWSKIESGRLDFTLRTDVAKAIQKMDIKQLQLYFDRLLLSEQSAKIAVTSKMSEVPEQWKILENWQSLKQEGEAFLN